jgi:ribosome-interacting GTPase 1
MPTNLPREWSLIDEEYRAAKNLDEKIEALKRLIAATPKHKGTSHLLADLRKKLSKLEDELERKSKKSGSRTKEVIKKTGDILVSIIGLTQSGKSTLLKSLTNASVDIDSRPYTTKEPVTGVNFFEGVHIQFVEIPSFFLKRHMNLAHASDMLLILANNQDELKKLEEILKENKLENKKKLILMNIDANKDYSELLDKVIKENEIVRVFTKPIGKPVEKKAVVLKSGSVVKDMIQRVNIAWLKSFKFARVFDNTKFSGRQVGLEYVLKDRDVVEIHTH